MPLETGTYISDLVSTNPDGGDGKSQGDDHLRLLKATIKATFPNITGAVTATHTQLGYAALINPTAGKTLSWTNTITLSGTDSRVYTFPTTNATLARTDAAQTFTGTQTFSGTIAGAAMTLSSTLAVTGDFAVNTNKFTVAAASGNTAVAGTLTVTGAASFSGNFTNTGGIFSISHATAGIYMNRTGGNPPFINFQTDGTGFAAIRGSAALDGISIFNYAASVEWARIRSSEARFLGAQGVWSAKFMDTTNVSGTVVSTTDVQIWTASTLRATINASGLTITGSRIDIPSNIVLMQNGTNLWLLQTTLPGTTPAAFYLADVINYDNGVKLEYSPGTVGAGAGRLIIGQTQKNHANYTHGITSFYAGGAEVVRLSTTGFGYYTGQGGTVTQITSKSTGVTLNKLCGQITTHAESINPNPVGYKSFVLTNSMIAAGDHVIVEHEANTSWAYLVYARNISAGSCTINIINLHTAALAEAIVLRFIVIKGATS